MGQVDGNGSMPVDLTDQMLPIEWSHPAISVDDIRHPWSGWYLRMRHPWGAIATGHPLMWALPVGVLHERCGHLTHLREGAGPLAI
jgi:hypothetical protein